MNITFIVPQRYVATRWLSVWDSAIEMISLFDVYTIFYFGFLSDEEKEMYSPRFMEIM